MERMPNSPGLLSMGVMIVEEGYGLVWPPYQKPRLVDHAGKPPHDREGRRRGMIKKKNE